MAKAKKTTPTRHFNTPERLEAIKAAIIAGESPKSIHEKFGTSLVNVHYHKARLKKLGLLDATTTKKTTKAAPVKAVATTKKTTTKTESKKTKTPTVKAVTKSKSAEHEATPVKSGKGPLSFSVNGTAISIDKKAKSVVVNKGTIIIEF